MSMKIINERKEPYTLFDLDLSKEEAKGLRDIGWTEIQKDDDALIQYGVEYVLRSFIGNLENNVKRLEKIVKENKKKK